jgi:hypothetical protein
MNRKQLEVSQSVQDVAERLITEFDGFVPARIVARIVLEAVADLNGQVQPEAFPELLHRLAHYRLEIGCGDIGRPPMVWAADVHVGNASP